MGGRLIKLVVWDLDETLWRGTLADGDDVQLFERRAELVRALNAHGVLSSICSKNDPDRVRDKLVALGMWDQFVFPRIAFEPKPQAIAGIIADMQLRPANTLFVDDNPINLHEASFALPELNILDARRADSDAQIEAILVSQPPSRNRVEEYRRLEKKAEERRAAPALSDEDFLRSCEIHACAVPMMANLDFLDRIVELVNRSNQLNYTASRIDVASLSRALIDQYLENYCWSIFASDRYGNHGLIGFVMAHRASGELRHFVFSCRIMHMGLENFALRVAERFVPGIKVPGEWRDRFGWSNAEWIQETPYEDSDTRQALFEHQGLAMASTPLMRIMCACQSGGLAHYSQLRNAIDFDIWPRLFALRNFAQEGYEPDVSPPYLVYGAGTDYKDESWNDLAERLDRGLYLTCVTRMCEFVTAHGIKLLVILPPENLAEHQYGPAGLTRERATIYNRIWRDAVQQYPLVVTLDVQAICEPADMIDVNHHRPAALQNVSRWIDLWYDHVRQVSAEQLAQAA